MKRFIILTLLACSSLVGLFAFRAASPAVLTFDELKHNFGFIRVGEVVSHNYTFTNTGDEPLIITDAEVACECTKVEFPKAPIGKGQKAEIKVSFDSKNTIDRQERTILVKSNAKNSPVTLTFKAVVLKAKK
ncbi:MAG: DUF1573 domain-containing protein [Bacteroidia bacterium]